MIILKKPSDTDGLRSCGCALSNVIKELEKIIVPGVTTKYIEQKAEELIYKNNAEPKQRGYNGFPSCLCASINDEVVHGIPSSIVLKENDLISIDISIFKSGFWTDSAFTLYLGNPPANILNLLTCTQECLKAGILNCKAGNKVNDISKNIYCTARTFGLDIIQNYGGHGLGKKLHEEPFVSNFYLKHIGTDILRVGTVLAIEPIITMGGRETYKMEDGWTVKTKDKSLTAHYEHTVIITENGPEILT